MPSKIVEFFSTFLSVEFKQQRLKAWQPLFTPLPVIATLAALGAIFVPVGIALVVTTAAVREVTVDYGALCGNASVCEVDVAIPASAPLRPPVYAYYELANYYQNYRAYAKSRVQAQLEGKWVASYAGLEDCDPRRSFNDSKREEDFYFPCGLIAWSFFNDSFVLSRPTDDAAANGSAYTPLQVEKDGIAWFSDKRMFKNPTEKIPGIRVVENVTDEDFLVWLRTAAFPTFRKLYRKVSVGEGELSGTLRLTVANNYPVAAFGSKRFVLSEVCWVGGRNGFLGWLYIALGSLLLVFAAAFALKQRISPRKFGDVALLPWVHGDDNR